MSNRTVLKKISSWAGYFFRLLPKPNRVLSNLEPLPLPISIEQRREQLAALWQLRRAGTLDLEGEEQLQEALQLNAPLAPAYRMKEDLAQIWEAPDRPCTLEHPGMVRSSSRHRNPSAPGHGQTLPRRFEGILSYFETVLQAPWAKGQIEKSAPSPPKFTGYATPTI